MRLRIHQARTVIVTSLLSRGLRIRIWSLCPKPHRHLTRLHRHPPLRNKDLDLMSHPLKTTNLLVPVLEHAQGFDFSSSRTSTFSPHLGAPKPLETTASGPPYRRVPSSAFRPPGTNHLHHSRCFSSYTWQGRLGTILMVALAGARLSYICR
jgi:hypothetical protein